MSIWATQRVSEEPIISLTRWSVFQTETGERHFCGMNGNEGRVTSALVSYDELTRTATTKSGRIIVLEGEPGWSSDADYVKSNWIRINRVTELVDVTEDYE
jgi:hypothetical protein